jgi:hypothetical protein
MTWAVDLKELLEARAEANKLLHAWKHDPMGLAVSTDEMFDALQEWIGLEIAHSFQEELRASATREARLLTRAPAVDLVGYCHASAMARHEGDVLYLGCSLEPRHDGPHMDGRYGTWEYRA